MKPTLLHAVMVAAFVVSPSQGNAQQSTGARAVHKLPPGGSLGLALGIPTVLPNLREVGGYKTADGATVARGLACRSDTFNPMSAEDIKKLERLGLKNDYDLRTTAEVKAKPDICRPGEVAPAECAGRRQVRRAGGTRSAPSPHPWTQRLRRCQSCFPNKELPQHKDFHRQNHPAMPTPLEPGPCN